MEQSFWKSTAFMGICFVLMAGVVEICQWMVAHFS